MSLALKSKVHKIIAIVLVVAVALGVLSAENMITFAYEAQTGMIYSIDKNAYVETFKEPSKTAEHLRNFEYGKPVTVIDEVKDAEGNLWYKINYVLRAGGEETSYCPAANVMLDKNMTLFAAGLVTGNNVKLRSEPGTVDTVIIASLNMGHKVELLDTRTLSNNKLWYRVRTVIKNAEGVDVTYVGWMSGTYIKEELPDIETDEAYEDYLRRVGFPESYIHNLAVLHELYPDWVFEPVKTGLDWATVIKEESYPNRNLVENTEDDAKKSTDPRAYNWKDNTWTIYDSSRWVAAHPDFIAYCMDPRNFLDATHIFMFESLSYSLSHNVNGVNAIIKNTFLDSEVTDTDGKVFTYANAFMEVGASTGVSPYHLASRVYQEQGEGKSDLISGVYAGANGIYKGFYNYFNIKASGDTTTAVIENGLAHAKTMGWTTRYASLLGGASFIANSYIKVGQNTLYFQKFDVIVQDGLYDHQYMQNVQAAISEGKKVGKGYADKQQAFVFMIPVYENMPEKAVQFTAKGNRNNYLSSLTVKGFEIGPTFDGAKTEYSLIVENSVASIEISATPVVSKSTVTGTGTLNLPVGTSVFKVNCKSESGELRTYTITVVRKEAGEDTEEDPVEPPVVEPVYSITSEKYKMGTYITGVSPETKVADFKAGFNCQNVEIKVIGADGNEKTDIVATGDKLTVYANGQVYQTYAIVIFGDVNGDGKISMGDLVKINRHILELAKLSDVYLVAGDVNQKNDGITMSDLVITNRHLLQLTTITQ